MKSKILDINKDSNEFLLNLNHKKFLEESSKTPNSHCISIEESMQKLNELNKES